MFEGTMILLQQEEMYSYSHALKQTFHLSMWLIDFMTAASAEIKCSNHGLKYCIFCNRVWKSKFTDFSWERQVLNITWICKSSLCLFIRANGGLGSYEVQIFPSESALQLLSVNSGAWETKTSLNSGNLTFNSSMRENKKKKNRFEEHLVHIKLLILLQKTSEGGNLPEVQEDNQRIKCLRSLIKVSEKVRHVLGK